MKVSNLHLTLENRSAVLSLKASFSGSKNFHSNVMKRIAFPSRSVRTPLTKLNVPRAVRDFLTDPMISILAIIEAFAPSCNCDIGITCVHKLAQRWFDIGEFSLTEIIGYSPWLYNYKTAIE